MRIAFLAAFGLALAAGPALAQDSTADASGAGSAASEVATHLTASGVRTALGVAAIPASTVALTSTGGAEVAGSVGAEASKGAEGSAKAAWGPLKVDDRVVVSPDPMPRLPFDAQKPK